MARPVTIFGDVSQGSIFFLGTRIRPAPLGGVVVAVEHPSPAHAGKIRVTRSDLFQRDGVSPRVIFKRMPPTRVKNKAGQFLVDDLGFTTNQVIDYINDQANKKTNEIDIQNNGALVGGGTTLNFKGAIDFIAVSNDVADICIDQVGIATTGGYVGTGVTLFDFRGSGVSTVTGISAGVATIFFEGGIGSGVGIGTTRADGEKLNWGDNNDLQIYHHSNGTGIIQNAGSGQLQLRSNEIRLLNQATDEDYAFFRDDGAVELFYDNVKRFETSGTGVTVTGQTQTDTLNVSGSSEFDGDIKVAGNIRHKGDTDTYIEFTPDKFRFITGGKEFLNVTQSGSSSVVINEQPSYDCDFRVEGISDEYLIFTDAATDKVGIGTTNPTSKLHVEGVTTSTGGFIGTIRSSDVVGLITNGQIDSLDGSKLTGLIDSTKLNPHITGLGGVNFTLGDSISQPAFDLTNAHSYPYSSLTGVPAASGGHNTTLNEFQWYQQYASPGTGSSVTGPGITTVNPGFGSNPYYYGTQLKPYQEMTWTHSLPIVGAYWVGIWGGSTTYTPGDAGNVALWEKALVFRNTVTHGHHIDNAGFTYDSTGFSFVNGVTQYTSISNNTSLMRLRYNGDTNKLEIWKGTTPVAIATATVAEDGNPITISAALSNGSHLPGITTVTYYQNQTNFRYHNSGAYLENSEHDPEKGIVYYGTPLHKGEEIVFSIPGNSAHIGVWGGGTGLVGIDTVQNKANWTTKWQYNNNRTDWEAATSTIGPTGVELPRDIQVDNGSYAIRYDHQTEKLQLWEIATAHDWLISSATAQVGVTTQHIYFSRGTSDTGGISLPSVSQVRSQDWSVISYTDTDRHGNSYWDGTKVNDVWKSNRSVKPGMKLKFQIPTTAANSYWATDFEGTADLGSGENNAYQAGVMTWRLSNQERLLSHEDCTANTNYTAMDSSTMTLALPNRNISWRYNSDNTWDIFDEDTDEVVITGDTALDGTPFYPHHLAVSNTDDPRVDYPTFTWEWNKAAWFMEYRDWTSGHSQNTWLILSANGAALMEAASSLIFSNGYHSIGSGLYNVTWGEKMRPGQEFIWTQLSINQNGATKHNMKIGVLDSTHRAYSAAIRFDRLGAVKEQSDQDGGFTLAAGIGTATATAGTSMRLKYEYGTNKLVCERVSSGVRTKIAESTSALDGNPIFISMGGDSTRLPTVQGVEVYGWECAHQPPNYYNPWENWRIGGFPENSGVGVGTTAGVLNHSADQVWRHKDGLASGYKMHWTLPQTATNTRFGVWKTSNAASGLTNVENNNQYWEWGWRGNTQEEILDLHGMTFNTSNTNYDDTTDPSAPMWVDPSPGNTKFSIRYHSNNTLDLFDESNGAIIATKDADCDGNPIFISSGPGGAMNNSQQLIDDFFGGGDVGIALTTTAV